MAEPYILLWLEAPLQAWGDSSKFGMRDTLAFPTKSGVLGLVCCALGAGGKQKELLAEFADLDMQVGSYQRCNEDGKLISAPPLLWDFQMVGNGYDTSDPWQNLLIPKTSEGKKAVGGGAKLTYRNYLQDMAFAVLLQVPANRATIIGEHLQNPVWDLYLGRKNCVPAEFIFQGQYQHSKDAWKRAAELAANKQRRPTLFILQGEQHGDEYLIINDIPIQFGPEKLYRDRKITLLYPTEGQNQP
ncbi:MAG: type I-E CRISPR-associated protein Cas5/CasD [Gammaproteobacteria bacterium]|nr:MAG: type I-E CRISPR-associated protein Cas5/CasD [Gammaproteobacteria bacterium]